MKKSATLDFTHDFIEFVYEIIETNTHNSLQV